MTPAERKRSEEDNDMPALNFSVSETDYDVPLPPPAAIARMLKSQCMEAIQKWHEKFGDTYKKLSLGYNFLKECKKVNSGFWFWCMYILLHILPCAVAAGGTGLSPVVGQACGESLLALQQ